MKSSRRMQRSVHHVPFFRGPSSLAEEMGAGAPINSHGQQKIACVLSSKREAMTPSRATIMKSFNRVFEISQCLKRPNFTESSIPSLVNGVTCLGGDRRMDGSCYYSQHLPVTASRRGVDL